MAKAKFDRTKPRVNVIVVSFVLSLMLWPDLSAKDDFFDSNAINQNQTSFAEKLNENREDFPEASP